jgi:hypothetical protein
VLCASDRTVTAITCRSVTDKVLLRCGLQTMSASNPYRQLPVCSPHWQYISPNVHGRVSKLFSLLRAQFPKVLNGHHFIVWCFQHTLRAISRYQRACTIPRCILYGLMCFAVQFGVPAKRSLPLSLFFPLPLPPIRCRMHTHKLCTHIYADNRSVYVYMYACLYMCMDACMYIYVRVHV